MIGTENTKIHGYEREEQSAGLPDEEVLYDLAEFFRMFADSTRIRILYALTEKEMCVNDIAEAVHMTQSAVSHQLFLLRTGGLVRFHREGRSLVYALSDDHVRTILNMGTEHLYE